MRRGYAKTVTEDTALVRRTAMGRATKPLKYESVKMNQRMHFELSEAGRARNYDARQNRRASPLSGPTPKAMIDKFAVIPILGCLFSVIVFPLFDLLNPPSQVMLTGADPRLENRIFWPAMAAISIFLAVRHRSRLRRPLPPHIVCFLVYLAFAAASVLWAFNPKISFTRFTQQAMIVTSIVLPAMLAAPTTDLLRGLLLWCFAPAAILNVPFVLENSPSIVAVLKGYPGYFLGKNALGELSAIPFLLALHEMFYPGRRRAYGIVVFIVATWLLVWANSKTAFGLAFVVPVLAGLTLFIRNTTRMSPAIILLTIPLCFVLLSSVSNFGIERVSYMIYGDSSLTGRTVIWDFANTEIARRPLLGWGYQSFWLAGPDAPSLVDAPGWVSQMPDAHNGYVDTKLELGYVGLALLVCFIIATLHGIGRVADRDPARAWLVLSLVLYIIVYNCLESLWLRGFEFLWVMFLVLAAEIGRYWGPFPLRGAARSSAIRRAGAAGPSPAEPLPRPNIGLP
jgi:exopolysaccharide production protein ExoQ